MTGEEKLRYSTSSSVSRVKEETGLLAEGEDSLGSCVCEAEN